MSKVPDDAFALYIAMGPERSYQAVADHFKVVKRTITRAARREDWSGRLAAIEKKTREMTDSALASDLHEMQLRHRKLLRAVAARAAKAISDFPLVTGMEGIKAAEIAVKLERLLAGETTESSALIVERVSRQEIERFVKPAPGSPADEGVDELEDGDPVETGGTDGSGDDW